jgi:hypothetical protein
VAMWRQEDNSIVLQQFLCILRDGMIQQRH